MIRTRIPGTDDDDLFRIITARLVPFARKVRKDVVFKRSDLRSRWKQCKVYVAEDAGHKPLGFVSCKTQGDILAIDMLAISRKAEGKGLGGRLLAAAERYGKRRGAASARLVVDEPNRHAQGFYLHHGYETEAYLEEHRMYIMKKQL